MHDYQFTQHISFIMASQRGAFIVIEGLDRSGKTTQVQKLADALSKDGHKVKALRFPGE